jgi:MOSC domain-containing protein YiiM
MVGDMESAAKAVSPEIEALRQRVAALGESPSDGGRVVAICMRPKEGERQRLQAATFTQEVGLVGDNWKARGSKRTADGSAQPIAQIAIMNSRVLQAIAGDDWERQLLAGDQLIVDLDLSTRNLQPGDLIQIGPKVLMEITDKPHDGCPKFQARFGKDALQYTRLMPVERRRGIYAKVLRDGCISEGDVIRKVLRPSSTSTLLPLAAVVALAAAGVAAVLLLKSQRK